MKILFIAPLPPPTNGQSLISQILKNDLENIHEIIVVDSKKQQFKDGFSGFQRVFEVFNILIKVFIRKYNSNALYLTISESYMGNIKDIFIYIICFKYLNKMVIHLHGGSIKRLLWDKRPFLFRFNKFFLKKMAGVIISGKSHKDIFIDSIKKNKIHIIKNFADESLFIDEEQIHVKFNDIEPINILFISSFQSQKGYQELLDSFKLLSTDEKKQFNLKFAGRFDNEDQRVKFESEIEYLTQVSYMGCVSENEKKELFKTSHIFCLPTSFFEGQPISILEAYAAGCVVLTTNIGGIQDIFCQNKNGFEIKERSPAAISETMRYVLEHKNELCDIAINNMKEATDNYRVTKYCYSIKKVLENINGN